MINLTKPEVEVLSEDLETVLAMDYKLKFEIGRENLIENGNSLGSSITNWSDSITDSLNKYVSYKEMCTFIKFNKADKVLTEIRDQLKYLYKSEERLYVYEVELFSNTYLEKLNQILKTLESLERTASKNASDNELISSLPLIFKELDDMLEDKANLTMYRDHLSIEHVRADIFRFKNILKQYGKISNYLSKNYLGSAISNTFLPPDNDNHIKVVYSYIALNNEFIGNFFQLGNELKSLTDTYISELVLVIKERRIKNNGIVSISESFDNYYTNSILSESMLELDSYKDECINFTPDIDYSVIMENEELNDLFTHKEEKSVEEEYGGLLDSFL